MEAGRASSLSELLPTFLPPGRNNFHRNPATVELTAAGVESPITRLLDDPEKNAERWRKLTYLADYEDAGSPKPGATVLASMNAGRRKLPLLITQNYGHGRTAVMATGGTWRWQMSEALGDPVARTFWRQLLRWLVAETPGPVTASMPARVLMDEGHVQLTAQVRDRQFQPAADAHVTAHVVGPEGVNAFLDLAPSPDTPGHLPGGLDRGEARRVSRRDHGGRRRRAAAGTGPRRGHVSARRRRRGEFSHRAEPPPARAARIADRRPLLEARRPEESAARYLLLRCRHLGAHHERALGYAHGVSRCWWACPPASGCCAASGVWYEARCSCWLRCFVCALQARAATYYVIVAGLGGEPDYEQRFTAAAKDLDKAFKASAKPRTCTR